MKTITVMIVYDDEHGIVRSVDDVVDGLQRAQSLIIQYGSPNIDAMANITALRDGNSVLIGSITRS